MLMSATSDRAFLIVDGVYVVALDRPVVSIGRKGDNNIVIGNPHVSRYHAHIRRVGKRYFLVDLGSTVGTSVNGRRIQEAELQSGDVISIGGVPLIFGKGEVDHHLIAQNLRPSSAHTGPTDATQVRDLDDYLNFFEPPETI